MPRAFISYKRNVKPDEGLALCICEMLAARGHEVFIDQMMPPGTRWARRIEEELERSDWLILLLSRDSVHSEMVRAELETARRIADRGGRPKILPVRVCFQEQFPYPMSAYLDGIQWALWKDEGDTQRLQEMLLAALVEGDVRLASSPFAPSGDSLAPLRSESMNPPATVAPVRLERPDEPVLPSSRFYVKRRADEEALQAISFEGGMTLTIRGPRQMGKTTLLNQVNFAAHEAKKRTAIIDFKLFNASVLNDPSKLFPQFCAWIADELDLEWELEPRWEHLPRAQACSRYMSRKILPQLDAPLVLSADELDRLFDSPARSEFFGMLRSWHEARAQRPIFRNLDMVLVTSTDPECFLNEDEGRGSPFNVGLSIQLEDFSEPEIDNLLALHQVSLTALQRRRLLALLGGHPYLTRRAIYLMASERWHLDSDATGEQLCAPSGPFSDHLRHYLLQLQAMPRVASELRRALAGKPCSNQLVFARLQGAGLLRGRFDDPHPRCELYEVFFRSALDA